jgi:hypothetical protein
VKSDYTNTKRAIDGWLEEHGAPVAAKLNRQAVGATVKPLDALHLMALCPLETAAYGDSPFCAVFSYEDWQAFELFWDLQKWNAFGYGNPLGPVQGVGWITELLSRLTGVMVPDETQTNHSKCLARLRYTTDHR